MSDAAQTTQDPTQPPAPAGPVSVSREAEGGIALGEPFPLKDIGTYERELPKEVIAVGVSQRPTNVKLPPAVQQLGVKAVGQPQQSQTQTVVLPLTDDQIAQGLKVSVSSSWRWLAEWCIRRIKQLHKRITHA